MFRQTVMKHIRLGVYTYFSCRYRVNATRKRKNFVVLSNQAEWQRDDGQNHVVKIGEKEKLLCVINHTKLIGWFTLSKFP